MRKALFVITMCLCPSGGACATIPAGIEVRGEAARIKADDGFVLWASRMSAKGQDSSPPRAIMVYAQGSEDVSIFRHADAMAGFCEAGIPVFGVERRGVSPDGRVDDQTAARYATIETRVSNTRRVLRWACEQQTEARPVLLLGASEGGDVASAVAASEKSLTGIILLGSGGGWTQEEEIRHFIRMRSGANSSDDAPHAWGRDQNAGYLGLHSQEEFDGVIARVRAGADSHEMWAGHPLKRWNSFLFRRAADDLLTTDVPILLVQGTADKSVPIESARALKDAFERAKKTNLTLVEIEAADHSFTDPETRQNKRPLVEIAIVNWMQSIELVTQDEARAFETRVRRNHPEQFPVSQAPVGEQGPSKPRSDRGD